MPRYLVYDPQLLFEPFLIKHDLKTIFDLEINTTKDPPSFEQEVKNEYDGTIILEKGHFQEALNLLKIAKRPLSFFVTEHRTASSFKKLKKEYGVDFVLQTPLLKGEVAALLRRLQKGPRETSEELPPELVAKYSESIYDKIQRIEELIHDAATSLEALKLLRNEVHKIAGSASSYGYPEASKSCKAHELVLMDALKNKQLSEELTKKNSIFLRKLRLLFQDLTLETKQRRSPPKKEVKSEETTENALVIVSSDLLLIQNFQNLAQRFRIPLVVESNPRKLQRELQERLANISGIIVEEYYPFTAVTGLMLIEQLKKSGSTIKMGIISNTENVGKRIAWSESGIDWVLKKPVTENNILQVFQQLERKQSFPNTRALIVDDDEDVGIIEKQILASMGIEVVYLQDERNLLKTLEEFAPHLLLLDVNLPYFNGQKLLKMLRADMRFQRMIIVIITAFQKEIQEDQIYQQNCDSIIYKPINPIYLQSRISNLLSRRMAVGLRTMVDPTTSLYEKRFYLQRVAGRLPHVRNQKGALILLEVDGWDQISRTLSAIEKKQILILVGNAIKQNFSSKSIYGYLSDARFSLFFEGYSGGEVEFMMETFLSEMRKSLWLSGREDLRFTMSIGITLFETQNSKIEAIISKTEEALEKAQDAGGKQLAIERLGESTAVSTETRRVILVDDDVDLTRVIAYMFENQGIHVDVFHTGADAIDFFAKLEQVDQNVLFILDRILPDRDGITLLRMIKEKFPGRVKAIFLTSLASEKDVLEGLQMGAVDYVIKPFSVPVLLQKAIALLNR